MSPSTSRPASSGSALRALSDDLAGAVERAAKSIVAIHARPRIPASGVYWRDGIVVATSHTIRRESDIAVTLHDGSRVRARLRGRDGGTDLAILELDTLPTGGSLALPERAGDDALRVGSLVLAVGRPGLEGVSASLGVVSAAGDRWRTWSGGDIDRFVRLDLAIYDGFSGSALVDPAGAIAGINSSALARGMPLTIPIATVDRIVDLLHTRGHVPRAYLGVAMQPVRLTATLAERHGLTGVDVKEGARGVLVVMVEANSPADQGGLLIGDVILAAEGRAVAEPQDVAELLDADRVGKRVELSIMRGGQKTTVTVTVGERDAQSGARERRPS